MTNVASHFPPLKVGGVDICLKHIEPMTLSLATKACPQGVGIYVVFANHCYSEKHDPAIHEANPNVWDGKNPRIFCPVRYELSKGLPGLINALPETRVYQTPEANYMRVDARPDGLEGEYRIYFHLKRAREFKGTSLKLFVESAYAPDDAKIEAQPVNKLQKVRFAVLVDSTVKHQAVKFTPKR